MKSLFDILLEDVIDYSEIDYDFHLFRLTLTSNLEEKEVEESTEGERNE